VTVQFSKTTLWRWTAGVLAAFIISNIATAYAFHTTPDDVRLEVERAFTDISQKRGMYVLEGRPRIAAVETRVNVLETGLGGINTRLGRIEATLEFLRQKAEEK